MSLECAAYRFLRWERKCHFILFERSPREWTCGKPDMMGITKSRYLFEIEIKRTVSDFKANENKRHRQNRFHNLEKQPKKFWYLVPQQIEEKVRPLLPIDCGLLVALDAYVGKCVERVEAPINSTSKKLSVQECIHVARLMANQMEHVFRDTIKPGEDYYQYEDWFVGSEYVI